MKKTMTILLSGLLLCGCSQKQASSVNPTADRIVAGKDILLSDGEVLRVAKRNGDSLEGIRIVKKTSDGKVTTITADTGTLVHDPSKDVFVMTLYHAKGETLSQTNRIFATMGKYEMVLP